MEKNINILEILESSPSVALLRARSSKIILEYFVSIFDDTTAVSHENIHNQLADFLNNHGVEVDEENDILLTDTYEEKAAKYVKRWTDNGFLTNYRNEDGEIYYEL